MIGKIKKLVRVNEEKPSGVDKLDVKLLKPVAELTALPISFNLRLELCVCPS